MKLLLKNIRLIAMFVLAVSFSGCVEDDVVLPKITAGFTYTLNAKTGTVVFINTSENSTDYQWDFGDATISKEINPVKTYLSGSYTVILTAVNVAGASGSFEDIIVINIPVAVSLPITFDETNVDYTATSFNGTSFEVVENPSLTGTNTVASNVGAITNVGATFEGINYDLGTNVNLSANKGVSMNFWANTAVDVLLKLEEGTGTDAEVVANHTGTGWEKIFFNFTSSDSFSRFTLFVDGTGVSAGTFYMDDVIQLFLGDVPVITLIGESNISIPEGGTYTEEGATASDTEDGDITSSILIGGDTVDPNTGGTYIVTYNVIDSVGNAALQVSRTVVIVGPDTKAPVITLNGSATINLSVGDSFTDLGATATDEIDGNISNNIIVAGDTVDTSKEGTYVITYNVSDAAGNAAAQLTRTVIVTSGGSSSSELGTNGDFETGSVSGWTLFVDATGASFEADTANPSSGSYSGKLLSDFQAGNGGAVDAVVKQANLGAGGAVTANTSYDISFDLRGSALTGGVFFVEFFSELSGGGVSKAEIITGGPHPLTPGWTTYSYKVTSGNDVSGGITLQMKSSCGPVDGCLVDVNIDNVSIKLSE